MAREPNGTGTKKKKKKKYRNKSFSVYKSGCAVVNTDGRRSEVWHLYLCQFLSHSSEMIVKLTGDCVIICKCGDESVWLFFYF